MHPPFWGWYALRIYFQNIVKGNLVFCKNYGRVMEKCLIWNSLSHVQAQFDEIQKNTLVYRVSLQIRKIQTVYISNMLWSILFVSTKNCEKQFFPFSFTPQQNISIEGKDNNFVHWDFLSPWNIFFVSLLLAILWQTVVKGNCLCLFPEYIFILFRHLKCMCTKLLIYVYTQTNNIWVGWI